MVLGRHRALDEQLVKKPPNWVCRGETAWLAMNPIPEGHPKGGFLCFWGSGILSVLVELDCSCSEAIYCALMELVSQNPSLGGNGVKIASLQSSPAAVGGWGPCQCKGPLGKACTKAETH